MDFGGLIKIPEGKLSLEDYREWIEDQERKVMAEFETMDRHSCLSNGYKLEEAITPGIYTRELTMPAGSIVFSRIHLQTHPYMVVKGKVNVYDGESIQTIEAPHKGITKAGTKRLLHVLEDTTWITFHPVTDETVEDCDRDGVITCETFETYDKIKGELCHL